MRCRDEQQWSMQCAVFDKSETGKQFYTYLTFWVNTAEQLMDEAPSDDSLSPYQALNKALPLAEEQIGQMDASAFMGQMLAFIISNWEHGSAVAHSLSNIELVIVGSAVQDHTAQMQAMAAQATAMAKENSENGVTVD